ncbi:MAG: hypothetical protein AB9917_00185 [Negativicutes bacterium]
MKKAGISADRERAEQQNIPDVAINALTKTKLKECFVKVDDLKRTIAIDKIQFILNESGDWEFNYLCTKTGGVIGAPQSRQRREQRLNLLQQASDIEKSSSGGFIQKEPTITLQVALANTGIKNSSAELESFLKQSLPNGEFRRRPILPEAIMNAVFDWQLILGTTADIIAIAGFFWAAYKKFIVPHLEEKKEVFIFIQVYNEKNEYTQIVLGKEYADEESFTKIFLENIEKIRRER